MVLGVANQLDPTFHTSAVYELFSHFHGIGIFYGSCCSQPAQYNAPGLHGVGCFMVLDAVNQLGTTLHSSTA